MSLKQGYECVFIAMVGCSSVFQSEKDWLQGTFAGDSVQGLHGISMLGIRAQDICHEHRQFLADFLFIGTGLFPATSHVVSFLLALGRVHNGSGCYYVAFFS